MAKQITLTPRNVFQTRDAVVKAVNAKFPSDDLRYVIMMTEYGCYYPVFISQNAIDDDVQFHFCVVV